MKRTLLFLFAALFAIVSCEIEGGTEYSNEDIDGFLQEVFLTQNKDLYYKVTSEQTFTPEEMADAVFGSDENIDAEALEAKDLFRKKCDEKREELLRENPNTDPAFKFKKTTFEYHTVNQKDQRITLSAFIGWAIHPSSGQPYDQDHIYFCCPYTHTKEEECATKAWPLYEFITTLTDNLFIMPDGQGFGADKNNVQTYLNHTLHAQQYYDALKVGYKLYCDEGGKFDRNWTLGVFGASQGGGDAIALHRYLDTERERIDLTNYYKDKTLKLKANLLCKIYDYPIGTKKIKVPLHMMYNFDYSFVCCGPYCPEVTMRTYSEWKKMSYPCVIPLVIKSMLACYPDELKYDEEEFFSGRWNTYKTYFDELYLKKTMNSADLNKEICSLLGSDDPMMQLSAMLSDNMRDTTSRIYNDLMACLRKQDLTTGWTPKTKTKLCFSKTDEVVPYANTEKLRALFKSSGCTYQDLSFGERGHVDCCEKYIMYSWHW